VKNIKSSERALPGKNQSRLIISLTSILEGPSTWGSVNLKAGKGRTVAERVKKRGEQSLVPGPGE